MVNQILFLPINREELVRDMRQISVEIEHDRLRFATSFHSPHLTASKLLEMKILKQIKIFNVEKRTLVE
jgi:hypothetical protein